MKNKKQRSVKQKAVMIFIVFTLIFATGFIIQQAHGEEASDVLFIDVDGLVLFDVRVFTYVDTHAAIQEEHIETFILNNPLLGSGGYKLTGIDSEATSVMIGMQILVGGGWAATLFEELDVDIQGEIVLRGITFTISFVRDYNAMVYPTYPINIVGIIMLGVMAASIVGTILLKKKR